MMEPSWPDDPRFYTKRINGQEFQSDRATLIARKVEWKNSRGWLYLWRKDRYVMLFGLPTDLAAEEVDPAVAMDLYDQMTAEQLMSHSKAFAKIVIGRQREEEM